VPEKFHGNFWSCDSYVVQYSYVPPGNAREANILYFWQGRNSTIVSSRNICEISAKYQLLIINIAL
jgi:hypothetical protein